jgi:uncharacterized membrane protein
MNKLIIWGITAFLLSSCTQVSSKSEKTITEGDDTISTVDISVSKTGGLVDLVEEVEKAESPKLLFKASGSEPGWFAEIYNNKLRLVVDYGKDSLIIEDTFKGFDNETNFVYVKSIIENKKANALALTIKKSPCVAASGDKAEFSVSFKLNNKSFQGCGNVIK